MLRRAIGMFEVDTDLLRLFSEVNAIFSCRWKDNTTDSEYEKGQEKGLGLSTEREITVVLQFFPYIPRCGDINKGIQRVDTFISLFYLESAFKRTPSRREFVLCFNSGLRISFVGIELDICGRENFINVCAIFTMCDMQGVIAIR